MDYRMRFSQRRRQIVVVWYIVQKRLERNMCMCYACRMQDGGDNSSAWRNYVSSSDTVTHSSLRGLEARSVCTQCHIQNDHRDWGLIQRLTHLDQPGSPQIMPIKRYTKKITTTPSSIINLTFLNHILLLSPLDRTRKSCALVPNRSVLSTSVLICPPLSSAASTFFLIIVFT